MPEPLSPDDTESDADDPMFADFFAGLEDGDEFISDNSAYMAGEMLAVPEPLAEIADTIGDRPVFPLIYGEAAQMAEFFLIESRTAYYADGVGRVDLVVQWPYTGSFTETHVVRYVKNVRRCVMTAAKRKPGLAPFVVAYLGIHVLDAKRAVLSLARMTPEIFRHYRNVRIKALNAERSHAGRLSDYL